jgi:spore coat polysaccharide biosynthesis protein SpsF (cytidylyltransferase family)
MAVNRGKPFFARRTIATAMMGMTTRSIHDNFGSVLNAMAIPGIDKVILATSTNAEDDILEQMNVDNKVEVVRGSEDDVLSRFIPSIKHYQPDHIIRITGDCPLISSELGEVLIDSHLRSGADATFTLSKTALGIALEVYKTDAVIKLRKLFPETMHSEYLIYYFLNNPDQFRLNIVEAPSRFIRPWRLTLDEANDLELFNLVYETLEVHNRPVRFNEVESFFEKHPEASAININNVVKYKQNQELIDFLKSATTFNKA